MSRTRASGGKVEEGEEDEEGIRKKGSTPWAGGLQA
jgi:hypothetical protein